MLSHNRDAIRGRRRASVNCVTNALNHNSLAVAHFGSGSVLVFKNHEEVIVQLKQSIHV
jgi:hypothetical protein